MLFCRKRLLVYRFVGNTTPESRPDMDLEVAYATRENIQRLFRGDRKRQSVFLRFLDKGYRGVIIHNSRQWLNYGWMSSPAASGPPHVPFSVRRRSAYWLFYGHTAPEARGRGLHRYSMLLRVKSAFAEARDPDIYTDTVAGNAVSRRGILLVGFEPKGMIDTCEICIPGVRSWVWGTWDMHADHPEMDGGTGR